MKIRYNYALAYIETIERAKFYCRFEGINIIFLTCNISVFLYLKFKKAKVYFVFRKTFQGLVEEKLFITSKGLENSLDVKLAYLSKHEAQIAYRLIFKKISKLSKKYNFKYIFIWNGCKLGDFACKEFASKHNIRTIYFEIANIPNKMFVDEQGTNKASSIFTNPEKLDFVLEENLEKYNLWKENYLKIKRANFILPQSKRVSKIKSLVSAIFNIIVINLGIAIQNRVYYKNFKIIFKRKIKNQDSNCINDSKEKYVFLPLQVSDDTQVVINSDVGLKDLIDYAYKYSQKNNLKLVIKPHPAERNNDILNYIKLMDKKDIIITNDNTFKLIEGSEIVITINSTVGLEGLILEKPVKFLGYSFYSKLDRNRLKNYIVSYLKDIDYFSNEKINFEKLL